MGDVTYTIPDVGSQKIVILVIIVQHLFSITREVKFEYVQCTMFYISVLDQIRNSVIVVAYDPSTRMLQ